MKKPQKNWLEWLVFGLSSILLIGIAAYLLYQASAAGVSQPLLQVSLGEPERVGGHFAVPVTVRNSGNATAESVLIEVVLEGTPEPERAELQIAFVPRRSTRRGWVTFPADPEGHAMRAHVRSYNKP